MSIENFARQFWESAFLAGCSDHGYSVEAAAEHADLALTEWRKRWDDNGLALPIPPNRRIA